MRTTRTRLTKTNYLYRFFCAGFCFRLSKKWDCAYPQYFREITPTGLTFVEIPRQRKAAAVDVQVRDELNEDGGRRCCERLRTPIAAVAADRRRPCVVTVMQIHVVVYTTQATFDV